MISWKYNCEKKSYNFNIRLNLNFKIWKNQASITLAMICVIVITPWCGFFSHIKKDETNENSFMKFFQIFINV
jgi:hypothetical protein